MMKKRLSALLLALAMGLSLAACAPSGENNSPAPDSSPSTQPDASASVDPAPSESIQVDLDQDILAFSADLAQGDAMLTVNGQEVPADLYLYWLALNCAYFEAQYASYGLPLDQFADSLREDSADMAAYYTLLAQMAVEQGCPLTDEQRAKVKEEMLAEGQESYDNRKALFGLSDETMEFIYSVEDYYDNVLQATVPAPTDEELDQYVYRAKHILLLTVDMEGDPVAQEDGSYAYPALDEATIAEKKAQAEDLLAQLKAADDLEATFDTLMNEYSEDTGLATNPDGYTTTTGKMVPEFDEAALSLGYGELSGIVESTYGYHILLRCPLTEDAKATYTQQYRESKLDAAVSDALDDAQVVQNDALKELDVMTFYRRYSAYPSARSEKLEADAPAESASGADQGDK